MKKFAFKNTTLEQKSAAFEWLRGRALDEGNAQWFHAAVLLEELNRLAAPRPEALATKDMESTRADWCRDLGKAGLPYPGERGLEGFAAGWDSGFAAASAMSPQLRSMSDEQTMLDLLRQRKELKEALELARLLAYDISLNISAFDNARLKERGHEVWTACDKALQHSGPK